MKVYFALSPEYYVGDPAITVSCRPSDVPRLKTDMIEELRKILAKYFPDTEDEEGEQ